MAKIAHWMMFSTFAEQRHFVYPQQGAYDGAIINGNMAAHAPDGLAAFLLEKAGGKLPYAIDPITHAFQHDPYFVNDEDGEPKSSIQKLAENYGEPVVSKVGKHPLAPEDFLDDGVLQGFVGRCLRFQRDVIAKAISDNPNTKYFEDDAKYSQEPQFLVSPYFYLTEVGLKRWLPVMTRMADAAKAQSGGMKVYISIVASQGVILKAENINEIANAFPPGRADGFLLWIDDLNEQAAGGAELTGLLKLARLLRNGDRPVINLHGGYFSILSAGTLGKRAFTGVTHGPEFGEFRSVVPVGGGIPIARYYIPQLHIRAKYRDARRFFDSAGWLKDAKSFYENVCNCAECQTTIGGDANNFINFGKGVVRNVRRRNGMVQIEYPTAETKLKCLRHYLQRKQEEYALAADADSKKITDDLRNGMVQYRPILGDAVDFLELWLDVLSH